MNKMVKTSYIVYGCVSLLILVFFFFPSQSLDSEKGVDYKSEKIINESRKYIDYHFKEGMQSLDDIQDLKIKEILIGISNYLINRSN